MIHEEAYIIRWIEFYGLNRPLVSYVWDLVSAGKGTPEFNALFTEYYNLIAVNPPNGRLPWTSTPNVDDIAARQNIGVEWFDEAFFDAGGEPKLIYCLQILEDPANTEWTGPASAIHPLALFSGMDPIIPDPNAPADYVRLALTAAGCPTDIHVEEVRFKAGRTVAKTFTINEVIGVEPDDEGLIYKQAIIKYYAFYDGSGLNEVAGWDVVSD